MRVRMDGVVARWCACSDDDDKEWTALAEQQQKHKKNVKAWVVCVRCWCRGLPRWWLRHVFVALEHARGMAMKILRTVTVLRFIFGKAENPSRGGRRRNTRRAGVGVGFTFFLFSVLTVVTRWKIFLTRHSLLLRYFPPQQWKWIKFLPLRFFLFFPIEISASCVEST